VVWHLSIPLMNSLNKTKAVIFLIQPLFHEYLLYSQIFFTCKYGILNDLNDKVLQLERQGIQPAGLTLIGKDRIRENLDDVIRSVYIMIHSTVI